MHHSAQRPRRLRANSTIRNMVQEHRLHPHDFIAPLFIVDGNNIKQEIESMPDYFRYSLDRLTEELEELVALDIQSVLLFVKVPDHLKDNEGKEALNASGLMQRSVRFIKEHFPQLYVMTDVALDPYSSFGHDGIVEDGEIINDQTVEVLARMSVSHAQAGCRYGCSFRYDGWSCGSHPTCVGCRWFYTYWHYELQR